MIQGVARPRRRSSSPPTRELYGDAAFACRAQVHAADCRLPRGRPVRDCGPSHCSSWSPRKLAFVLALVQQEMLLFALSDRPTFHMAESRPPGLAHFFESHPGDYRALVLSGPDVPMSLHAYGIWGYGPLLPGRFAEFMYASQGLNPDQATPYLMFNEDVPIYRCSRGRFRTIGGTESTGTLAKDGAGTLTLSGANTFSGGTTIGSANGASGGTIQLGANNTLPGDVTVYAGTLSTGTYSDTIGALSLGGGASGTTAAVSTGDWHPDLGWQCRLQRHQQSQRSDDQRPPCARHDRPDIHGKRQQRRCSRPDRQRGDFREPRHHQDGQRHPRAFRRQQLHGHDRH